MPSNKQYPVKILDNLYVFNITNPKENEKEEFLKLSEIERMDLLILKEPEVKQSKSGFIGKKFYTPSFGNFIISPFEKELLQFYDIEITRRKSGELFSKFKAEYLNMIYCFERLEKFIYSRYTL